MPGYLDPPRFPTHQSRGVALPKQTERAVRRAEATIVDAALGAWVASEVDQLESMALREAATTATEIEFDFYDRFGAAAGNSPVKQELLARKLDLLSYTNSRRIARRFG